MKKTLLIVAVVGVVSGVTGWAFAQQGRPGAPQAPQAPTFTPPVLTVLSGNDIGFRIEEQRDGVPVGVLVVKVNGAWVAPAFTATGPRARPLTDAR